MITFENRSGTCHAQVNGDLTIYTAQQCRDLLLPALADCQQLEVDLSGVTDIDSAGVQILIAAKREGARLDKPVRLVAHSPSVLEIIDLYRLAGEFGDLMIIPPRQGETR